MPKDNSSLQKAGLAIGLATFLITNAHANPFQAEVLKTGYGNTGTQDNSEVVTPHSYPGPGADDVTPGSTSANTPHADEPPVASDRDPFSEQSIDTTKASDGKCGMSGNGE